MKQSKKLLAMIMAVLMIVSVMPVAFAAECEHELNMDTLVRPKEGELTGYYVCAGCGENIEVKRADYEAFFKVQGKIEAIIEESTVHVSRETTEDYYRSLLEKYELNKKFNHSEFFSYIEQEQDEVDELVALFENTLTELVAYVEENQYTTAAEISEYLIGLYRINYYIQIFGLDLDFNEETQNKIEKFIIEAEEDLDRLEEKEFKDFTQEEIAIFNGYYAKIGYLYNRIADCMIGKHDNGKAIDNGEGKHITSCEFCGEVVEEADHIWGEYILNDNDTPCDKVNTMTAKCIACDAEDTVETNEAGKHVNKDHDDYCDVCDEKLIERCTFCDKEEHTDYTKYICILTYFIKLFVGFFQK